MPLLVLPRRWNNIAQTQLAKNITWPTSIISICSLIRTQIQLQKQFGQSWNQILLVLPIFLQQNHQLNWNFATAEAHGDPVAGPRRPRHDQQDIRLAICTQTTFRTDYSLLMKKRRCKIAAPRRMDDAEILV
jgi:hypothetical protein